MARRILHFGERQLYWECQTHDACESYPTGNSVFGGDIPFKSRANGGLDILAQSPSALCIDSRRLRFWYKIL